MKRERGKMKKKKLRNIGNDEGKGKKVNEEKKKK